MWSKSRRQLLEWDASVLPGGYKVSFQKGRTGSTRFPLVSIASSSFLLSLKAAHSITPYVLNITQVDPATTSLALARGEANAKTGASPR